MKVVLRSSIRDVTITIHDFDGDKSLTFYTGDLPADGAVIAAGHEPNGYFWEGLTQFAWPDLAGRLDFDSEAGMFAAQGQGADLEALRSAIEPLITSREAVGDMIARATAAGFEFDD